MEPFDLRHVLDDLDHMARGLLDMAAGSPAGLTAHPLFTGPPMTVDETNSGWQLHLEVPGINPDNIQIDVNSRQLQLHINQTPDTTTSDDQPTQRGTHHQRKMQLERTFGLPADVNTDTIAATCHQGLLTITLPRTEHDDHRTVPIQHTSHTNTSTDGNST